MTAKHDVGAPPKLATDLGQHDGGLGDLVDGLVVKFTHRRPASLLHGNKLVRRAPQPLAGQRMDRPVESGAGDPESCSVSVAKRELLRLSDFPKGRKVTTTKSSTNPRVSRSARGVTAERREGGRPVRDDGGARSRPSPSQKGTFSARRGAGSRLVRSMAPGRCSPTWRSPSATARTRSAT
jgi:hypothetical protein